MKYFDKWYRAKGSCPIENCPEVLMWFSNLYKTIEGCKRSSLLYRDNRKTFRKIWGKPDSHWVGGSENRRFAVWLRPLGENDVMIVLTHGIKGTVYEVARTDFKTVGNHSKDIIGFLEDTLNELEKYNG